MEKTTTRLVVGIAIVSCCLCAGCSAKVNFQREAQDSKGVRYYESAPYLLVYSDGKGGLKWQILYLPDQSHIMTASPEVRGGKTQMTLYFQNGALASSTISGDTTTIPNAFLAAAQAAIPSIVAALAEKPEEVGFPKPYLFKIIAQGDSIEFRGGPGDASIRVPIQKGLGG